MFDHVELLTIDNVMSFRSKYQLTNLHQISTLLQTIVILVHEIQQHVTFLLYHDVDVSVTWLSYLNCQVGHHQQDYLLLLNLSSNDHSNNHWWWVGQ